MGLDEKDLSLLSRSQWGRFSVYGSHKGKKGPFSFNSAGRPSRSMPGSFVLYGTKKEEAEEEESRVPSDYIELEYIESTGTQYIKTGVNYGSNTSIELDYQLTQAVQSRTGLYGGLVGGRFGTILSPSNNQLEFGYGSSNVYWQLGLPDTNRHLIEQKKNQVYFDGTLVYTFATATFSINWPLWIGNFDYTGYTPAKAKYFGFKMWDGDTLVRDFVPAKRKSDGAVGLFDFVGNKFYGNDGTGEFIAGPEFGIISIDYLPIDYIESSGTQWIDTLLDTSRFNGVDVLIDFQLTEINSTYNGVFGTSYNYPTAFGLRSSNQNGGKYHFEIQEEYFDSSEDMDTNRHTVQLTSDKKLYIDGVLKHTFTQSAVLSSGQNVFLFNLNSSPYSTASRPSSARLYRFKVGNIADFIPVIVRNECALYDRIGKRIYKNRGTGTFTAGLKPYQVPLQQLVLDGNFESTSVTYWDKNRVTMTVSSNTVSCVSNSSAYSQVSFYHIFPANSGILINGHKYLMMADFRLDSGKCKSFTLQNHTNPLTRLDNPAIGEWNTIYNIFTQTREDSEQTNGLVMTREYTSTSDIAVNSDTFSVRRVMLFDLTAMFGSGKEPATAEEFKGYFPDAYYPYTAAPVVSDLADLARSYRKVEYLESTGTQYIDTGVNNSGASSQKYELDFLPMPLSASSEEAYFGAQMNSSSRNLLLHVNNAIYLSLGSTSTASQPIHFATPSSRTTFEASVDYSTKKFSARIDGVDTQEYTYPGDARNDADILLFAYTYTSGARYLSRAKVYSFKIWQDGIVKRDLIPIIRKSDSKPGMFDTVSRRFMANAGTGEFLAGPVDMEQRSLPSAYQEVEYLDTSGTQYIDTGIVPAMGMGINVKCALTGNLATTTDVRPLGIYVSSATSPGRFYPFYWNRSLGVVTRIDKNNVAFSTSVAPSELLMPYELQYDWASDGAITSKITTKYGSDTKTGTSTYVHTDTMFLFNINGGGVKHDFSPMRIYSCSISKNGVLARDYIPCIRKSDNAVGMYDIVSKQFFINQGTGTFTAGPIVYRDSFVHYNVPIRFGYLYDELEYIESNGTQYIDTDLIVGTGTKVEFDFQPTDLSVNGVVMGARNAVSSNPSYSYTIWQYLSSTGKMRLDFKDASGSSHSVAGPVPSTSNRYHVVKEDNKNWVDGVEYDSNAMQTFQTNYTLYLFACHENGAVAYQTHSKLFYARIWQGNTLVRDFIPVKRKSDGAIGMFDKVENKFYANQGTGVFVAGPTIQRVEYIESSGTQYIDTGFKPNPSTTKCETRFTPLATGWQFGARKKTDVYDNGNACLYANSKTLLRKDWIMSVQTFSIKTDSIAEFSALNNEITVNGTTSTAEEIKSSSYLNYNFVIFGVNTAGTITAGKSRNYGLRLYDDGTLVRDFVPVKVGNEYAMLDLVERKVYRNAGTGSFTGGNIVKDDSVVGYSACITRRCNNVDLGDLDWSVSKKSLLGKQDVLTDIGGTSTETIGFGDGVYGHLDSTYIKTSGHGFGLALDSTHKYAVAKKFSGTFASTSFNDYAYFDDDFYQIEDVSKNVSDGIVLSVFTGRSSFDSSHCYSWASTFDSTTKIDYAVLIDLTEMGLGDKTASQAYALLKDDLPKLAAGNVLAQANLSKAAKAITATQTPSLYADSYQADSPNGVRALSDNKICTKEDGTALLLCDSALSGKTQQEIKTYLAGEKCTYALDIEGCEHIDGSLMVPRATYSVDDADGNEAEFGEYGAIGPVFYPMGLNSEPYLFRAIDGNASMKQVRKIVGNTIKWNQLVQNGNFESTLKWYMQNGSFSVSNGIATFTPSSAGSGWCRLTQTAASNPVVGHKYAVMFDLRHDYATQLPFQYNFGKVHNTQDFQPNQWVSIANVYSCDSDSAYMTISLSSNLISTLFNVQVRNVMLFDLTALGLDNITTIDQFYETDLGKLVESKGYLDYTQGSLATTDIVKMKNVDYEGHEAKEYPTVFKGYGVNGIGDEYYPDGHIIRKFGIIDLGTLDGYMSNDNYYVSASANPFGYTSSSSKDNGYEIVCSLYSREKASDLYAKTKNGICLTSPFVGNNLIISDTRFVGKTAQEVKTMLSGVQLVYELATSTTKQGQRYIEEQIIYNYGTEEFVFKDGELPISVGHETVYYVKGIV